MMSNDASICSAVMHRGGASRIMLPFPEKTIFAGVEVESTQVGQRWQSKTTVRRGYGRSVERERYRQRQRDEEERRERTGKGGLGWGSVGLEPCGYRGLSVSGSKATAAGSAAGTAALTAKRKSSTYVTKQGKP